MKVTLIASLLLSSLSFGWSWGSRSVVGDEESLCYLKHLDKDGNILSSCSGILTGTREVRTNAHCVFNPENVKKTTVHCGFQGIDEEKVKYETSDKSEAKTMIEGQIFKASREVKEVFIHKEIYRDEAIITLNEPIFDIEPAPLFPELLLKRNSAQVPETSEDQYMLHTAYQCKISGFGLNDELVSGIQHSTLLDQTAYASVSLLMGQDGNFSDVMLGNVLNFALHDKDKEDCYKKKYNELVQTIDTNEVTKLRNEILLEAVKDGLFQGIGAPGDSGGAIFCRLTNDSDWKLLAMNSAINLYANEGRDPFTGMIAEKLVSQSYGVRLSSSNDFVLLDEALINKLREEMEGSAAAKKE